MEYRIMLAVDGCTTLTLRFLAASWWKIHLHVVEFLSAIFSRFHVRLYIRSVRRCLKSPRFVLYLHTILFVARHVIESLLHKWEETSLNISGKEVDLARNLCLFPLPLVLCELTFFSNRPFPSRTKPPFQSEVKCKAIYMKMTFILLQVKLIFTRK